VHLNLVNPPTVEADAPATPTNASPRLPAFLSSSSAFEAMVKDKDFLAESDDTRPSGIRSVRKRNPHALEFRVRRAFAISSCIYRSIYIHVLKRNAAVAKQAERQERYR